MANKFDWQGSSVKGDYSQQHNGNINGNVYNNYNHNPNKRKPPEDGSYERGLISATQAGSMKRVERYLNYDINVDFADGEDRTALHWAVIKGHENIARLLIESCCNIDHESEEHGTPLCQAVVEKKASIAQLLLQEGAYADAASGRHGSALHAACKSGSLEIVVLLLEARADANLVRTRRSPLGADADLFRRRRSPLGVDPVWYFAGVPLRDAANKGHSDIVSALLSAGADVNVLNVASSRPLPEGHEKWSEAPSSLEGVVFISQPVHDAAFHGHEMVLKSLLDAGAVVDALAGDLYQYTPILLAAQEGHTECIRLLLAHGASVGICNSHGCSPLSIAACNGQLACLNLLLDNDSLVDRGNDSGWTPLMHTVSEGYKDCAELLLTKGSDVTLKQKFGNTALHLARDGPCVRLLVSHGAQMDVRNKNGKNPLMHAADSGRQSSVEALLDVGTPLHGVDINGRNAYDLAKRAGEKEIAELLKKHGARPSPKIMEPQPSPQPRPESEPKSMLGSKRRFRSKTGRFRPGS